MTEQLLCAYCREEIEGEAVVLCAYCREEIEGEAVVRMGKNYCSEACAFEATSRPRPKQCGVPVGEAARDNPTSSGRI